MMLQQRQYHRRNDKVASHRSLMNGLGRRGKVLNLLFFCLISSWSWSRVSGKKVSGRVRLSGVRSEHVMTKFAVFKEGGKAEVMIQAVEHMYENIRFLKVHLYRDTDWPRVQQLTTCDEKVRLAQQTLDIVLTYHPESHKYQTDIMNVKLVESDLQRPHYWYFVIDDCSLEHYFQDDRVPTMKYEISVWNFWKLPNGEIIPTHLSADEQDARTVHELNLVVSGLVAILLMLWMLYTLCRPGQKEDMIAASSSSSGSSKSQTHSIHIAAVWVMVAASLDSWSSLFATLHWDRYHHDGVGQYVMDALAAHCEAMCDAVLMLFLLAMAAGWTLPGDVVTRPRGPHASAVQRFWGDLAQPMAALMRLNGVGLLGVAILAAQAILAQWGRIYNDDFESYHTYGHLPGQLLLLLRGALALLFLVATVQTKLHCKVPQLQSFYSMFGLAGMFWFVSLPILVALCNLTVPFYLRRPTIYTASAILQFSSIATLAWLVSTHSTSYHQFSRMSSAGREDSLTDRLMMSQQSSSPSISGLPSSITSLSPSLETTSASSPAPTTWKIAGKAKVRLD